MIYFLNFKTGVRPITLMETKIYNEYGKNENGNLQDSAEVVRDLLRRNKENIKCERKQMLDNARK